MLSFFFAIDWIALWISLGALAGSYLAKKIFFSSPSPYFSFSVLKNLSLPHTGRSSWSQLPYHLKQIALACFVLAFIDPHLMTAKGPASTKQKPSAKQKQNIPLPTEGIAIYLDLDQSGSMNQAVEIKNQQGRTESIRKIDLLKQVTKDFIQNESSNLIGLVGFARIPNVLAPLTLDQDTLLDQLNQFNVVKNRDEDGTSIGYAIFKTAHLIVATRHFAEELKDKGKPAYEIKGAAIIVVTDGLQDPSPLDKGNRLRTIELEDAAEYAKSQNIRVYLINIDPTISLPEYAPHRRQMQKITELTGGKFYLVREGQDLQHIYADIDQLEKGIISSGETTKSSDQAKPKSSLKNQYNRTSFYPFFIALGLLCLIVAMILETTLLRKVP